MEITYCLSTTKRVIIPYCAGFYVEPDDRNVVRHYMIGYRI